MDYSDLVDAMAFFADQFYVPTEYRDTLAILLSGGPENYVRELERLADGGSPAAAAMLAAICLHPNEQGQRDAARAISLCSRGAARSDAYAQYILAWALFHVGRPLEGKESLESAADSGFSPAIVDRITWALSGIAYHLNSAHDIVPFIQRAVDSGHCAAIATKAAIYRLGKLGFGRRLLGYLLFPVGFWKRRRASVREPFSERNYLFNYNRKHPMFRKQLLFSPRRR
jgi:TPR repeat protein